MAQFSEEWLEKVKASINIVEFIGRKIELRQSGQNWVGLCPFHDEKTPSFNVNPQKQFFHCFGCGVGGNVFNFVMRTENVSFPEAVRIVAKEAGIPLPPGAGPDPRRQEQFDRLYAINHLAARYFYRMLRTGQGVAARRYLTGRGIDGNLAKRFLLGYAPAQWHGLLAYLKEHGISPEEAQKAGLVSMGKNGYFDRFRDRVIFPICDYRGRFLGFGGRLIREGNPKYLNSPETLVFQKSKILYGLNWAKEAIAQEGFAVIVEGYTDCIALAAKGIVNVVASLGTSFTEEHAKLLRRFTDNVVIAFDGDSAGEKATQRGMALLRQLDLQVRVASLKEGQDPDTFARTHTSGELREWISSALPLLEYQIRRVCEGYDLSSREGKLQASQEIIDILGELDNRIEQDEYSQFAAKLLDVDPEALFAEVVKRAVGELGGNLANRARNSHIIVEKRYTSRGLDQNPPQSAPAELSDPSITVERDILRLTLAKPALMDDLIKRGFTTRDFQNADYRHLYNLLLQGAWDKHGEAVASELFEIDPPVGDWEEFLQQFQVIVWSRKLKVIEEKLTSMENLASLDILVEISRLLVYYHKLRKDIFLSIGKK